jgi:hypothetical protein
LRTLRLLTLCLPLQRPTHKPPRVHMHMAMVLMRVRM